MMLSEPLLNWFLVLLALVWFPRASAH